MIEENPSEAQAAGPHPDPRPAGEGASALTLLDVLEKTYPESSRTKLREVIAAKAERG